MRLRSSTRRARRWVPTVLLAMIIATPVTGYRSRHSRGEESLEGFSPLFSSRLDVALENLEQEDGGLYFQNLTRRAAFHPDGGSNTPLSASLSACWLSGCVFSVCTQSGCIGSVCEASFCMSSACIVSACLTSYCGASACVESRCLASACIESRCVETCEKPKTKEEKEA